MINKELQKKDLKILQKKKRFNKRIPQKEILRNNHKMKSLKMLQKRNNLISNLLLEINSNMILKTRIKRKDQRQFNQDPKNNLD